MKPDKQYTKGWRAIIYVVGLLLGVWMPFFWIVQYGLYLTYNFGDDFFGVNFNRRTYYWGWWMIGLLTFSLVYPPLFLY